MTQQLDSASRPMSWAQGARVKGILRYHSITLGKILLWVMVIMLGSQVLGLLIPILFQGHSGLSYLYVGISSDIGTVLVVSLVCGHIVAGRSTRFLLRFGASRFSVWLCNVLALIAAMALLLLGCLLVNITGGFLTLWAGQLFPDAISLQWLGGGLTTGFESLSASLVSTLQVLPKHLLWVAEWTCLFYLLGCCMRRSRGWTLAVVIGIPLALMMITVIPSVRQAVEMAMNADQSELMIMGLKWWKWLQQAAQFIADQWQWIQLGAALVSLPLSYLCMRGTKQP